MQLFQHFWNLCLEDKLNVLNVLCAASCVN